MVYHVYILANKQQGSLHVDITHNLPHHMENLRKNIRTRLKSCANFRKLVYTEPFETLKEARQREKQLKHWYKNWKLHLIESVNPEWKDLSENT